MWWLTGIGIYLGGFAATFWFNAAIGPLTLELCVLRAVIWPVWWVTGWPQGSPMPLD